jgi:hypothetical protein
MVKNYYFILGVPNNASASDITDAYEAKKRLAERDAMGAAMLGEATEAYECLSNSSRRQEYDRTMTATPARSAGNTSQYSSHESRIMVELEFKKLRKQQNSKKKIVKNVTMIAVFLVFAGTGIRLGIRHFVRKDMTVELPALTLAINATDDSTESEAEKPAASAERIKTIKPSIRMYETKTGGIVIRDRASCRAEPSLNASVTATMHKDAVVFASKEIRYGDGNTWYYIFNSQFEGWVNGTDVHIYNKY